jgi:multicomponent K+:H+ antiporter subunit D
MNDLSHWIVMPVVLPALAAAALIMLRPRPRIQRMTSLAACAALALLAAWLTSVAARGGLHVYALGDWPAPFGIVLVLDRLAALMLLATAVMALGSLLYALRGRDADGGHFHALFLFQLMGINGAFLTGDLFNLFVFFEVLLIASYCLLLHGGRKGQLVPGLHYVAINFTGSFLFLVGVSLLYAMTGTLNMADMAQKVAAAPAANAAPIRAGALLLLVVFAIKAALFPLYFWLPRAYGAAEAPVAALFAIMTKVGVYAILRVGTLVFGPDAGVAAAVFDPWLLPAALLTVVMASFGVLAGQTLRTMAGYLNIASVGVICVGIGMFSPAAIGAALYYLLHSTLAIGLLFLLIDLIRRRRTEGDRIRRGAAPAHPAALGLLYFGAAIAVVGLPPLSGFLGKAMLLQAAHGHQLTAWVWAVVLANALLAMIAMARAGSLVFWHIASPGEGVSYPPARRLAADAAPVLLLLACILALSAGAQTAAAYTAATAEQLLQPGQYIGGVLRHGATAAAGAVR